VGRVNSLSRLRHCHALGAHSVDGTGYSRYWTLAETNGRRDMQVGRHIAYLRELENQGVLFA
jgi:hypothetical protein